mgnify:CR=1 FL=1
MEKNKIEISAMSINDLESIQNILLDSFDSFWSYETLLEELHSQLSTIFVAKYNNEIVGFTGIKKICDEAELMNIVTRKDYRHHGIASAMLEYIISFCKNLSCINLEVNSKNSIAINLYKKYNFKQVGLRKKYYNNVDDAILMTLKLNG